MKYFGNWKVENAYGEMRKAFEGYETYDLPEDFPAPKDVLFAGYFDGSYSGWARVLYRNGGKLYEVEASHCSCNGLGGQWEHGGEVTPGSLAMRGDMPDYYDIDDEARGAWSALIKRLVKEAR
jgi:hypothetical protein